MAEPTIPAGKGPWSKLSPKQKRMAAVAGAAGLLALIFLLSRRGTPAATDAPVSTDAGSVDPSQLGAGAANAPPYSFTDPGAYAGQLGTAVTDALGGVQQAVVDAHLNQIPRQVSNLQHIAKRENALIRQLEHELHAGHHHRRPDGGHRRRRPPRHHQRPRPGGRRAGSRS